ncbi:uncharacterized protein LOC117105517 [Anneissia japonica]|uniref:uncharacterized protein LOC117105517 n=1 Tax=Anneissia japonica TaxID=1529436 RepID=UPI0014257F94|nr:uncharacterized protein LOC117105517 [Anneissia japonica]XP_033102571.1 uncharacterized protein LOC117105517 [Anneissia japonica]
MKRTSKRSGIDFKIMSSTFFRNQNVDEWMRVLGLYQQVLKLKASNIKKPEAGKTLIELDKWYQEKLSHDIQGRKDRYLTHAELTKLMSWKLARGKFRPRLAELVQTNTPELVETSSKKAFQSLPDLKSALKHLVVLKAVGPATASAILAAGAPDQVAFMADESMLEIPGLAPLNYNAKQFDKYMQSIQECVERLNKQDPEKKWTPHTVELTLWTNYVANKLDPTILEEKSKKRKSTENSGDEVQTKKNKES